MQEKESYPETREYWVFALGRYLIFPSWQPATTELTDIPAGLRENARHRMVLSQVTRPIILVLIDHKVNSLDEEPDKIWNVQN